MSSPSRIMRASCPRRQGSADRSTPANSETAANHAIINHQMFTSLLSNKFLFKSPSAFAISTCLLVKKKPRGVFSPSWHQYRPHLISCSSVPKRQLLCQSPSHQHIPQTVAPTPTGFCLGGGGRRLQRWGGPPQQCSPTSAGGCAISRCLGTQSTSQHGCPALRRRSARVLSETGGGEGGQTPPFAGGGPRPPPPLRPSPGPPLLPNFFLRRIAP